jgi:hypothetical protein
VDAFSSLSLDNLILGESWVEEHDLGPQTLLPEGVLNPGNKVPVDFLLQNNLNVRDVSAIPSRQVKLGIVSWLAVRTWASSSV